MVLLESCSWSCLRNFTVLEMNSVFPNAKAHTQPFELLLLCSHTMHILSLYHRVLNISHKCLMSVYCMNTMIKALHKAKHMKLNSTPIVTNYVEP